jgi:ribonuclease III
MSDSESSGDELTEAPPLNRVALEALIGTKVNDITLYQRAFTHKSALKRYYNLTTDGQTLEFLGDSVLGFIVTKMLFDKHEVRQEGFLTKARTKLVRGTMLANIARNLGLHQMIYMDEKAQKNSWFKNDSICEDVFESLIGAIYLDLGLVHAKRFILSIFENLDVDLEEETNAKDVCLRYSQRNKLPLPEYRMVSHVDGIFTMQVVISGRVMGQGYARTKKEAEQIAARQAMVSVGEM